MLDPLLAIAIKEPLTRTIGNEAMQEHFKLTEEERAARIPSGHSTVVRNRTGWAMTFLTKAGLIHKVAPKTYRATEKATKTCSVLIRSRCRRKGTRPTALLTDGRFRRSLVQ
jgi:restriction endonuclease Mrr